MVASKQKGQLRLPEPKSKVTDLSTVSYLNSLIKTLRLQLDSLNNRLLSLEESPFTFLEASGNVDAGLETDIVWCTGTLTVNLVDPSIATRPVTVRNISGTTTITADAGTVETTSLTVGQATTLAPRATGWFEI